MNPIDLTTVAAVTAWLNQSSGLDAALLGPAITGYSAFILTKTGRPFLSGVASYTERYDGNGSALIQLRNYPILAVAALSVSGTTIYATPDYIQPGFAIDQSGSKAALVLIGANANGGGRSGICGGSPWGEGGAGWPGSVGGGNRFWEGRQNVAVSYTAGYTATAYGEAGTVPATGPYTIKVAQAATFYADVSVTTAAGASLAGQYSVSNGTYTFNSALRGSGVLISYQYGAPPADLAQAVTEIIAERYRTRGWIGLRSVAQPGVGTTSYASWAMSPANQMIVDSYRTRFIV
jgi:hypothetical protein